MAVVQDERNAKMETEAQEAWNIQKSKCKRPEAPNNGITEIANMILGKRRQTNKSLPASDLLMPMMNFEE